MTEKAVRTKTPKAIAETPPLYIERQEGVDVVVDGVRWRLKGLTWPEEERVGSIQAAHTQAVYYNHTDSRPELDDFDFQVGDVLMLRLGVHDAEPLEKCAPEVRAAIEAAKAARKEMTIGEGKRLVFDAAVFAPPFNGSVARQFLRKIEELTKLGQQEEIKLVFTSPQ